VKRWKDHWELMSLHGVGGSFDVFAGVTKRAPRWVQSAGLEWLYRVSQEPIEAVWTLCSVQHEIHRSRTPRSHGTSGPSIQGLTQP